MKRLSRIQRRLIRSAVEIESAEPGAITYQHTVFCQTGLPYRSPGAAVREWGRRQGNIALQVSAGAALHPESGEWVHLPLPFGPKPRLILTHFNREALLRSRPMTDAELTRLALAVLIQVPFAFRLGFVVRNGREWRFGGLFLLIGSAVAALAASSLSRSL